MLQRAEAKRVAKLGARPVNSGGLAVANGWRPRRAVPSGECMGSLRVYDWRRRAPPLQRHRLAAAQTMRPRSRQNRENQPGASASPCVRRSDHATFAKRDLSSVFSAVTKRSRRAPSAPPNSRDGPRLTRGRRTAVGKKSDETPVPGQFIAARAFDVLDPPGKWRRRGIPGPTCVVDRLEVVAALVLDFDEHDAVLTEIDDHVRLGKRIWVFSQAGAQLAQTPLDLLSTGTGIDRSAPQEGGRCCHQGGVGNQSGLPQGAQQLTGTQNVREDHPGHGVFRGGKAEASPLGFAVANVAPGQVPRSRPRGSRQECSRAGRDV